MKSFPLPVRVAAGLAVIAVEQARTLPTKLAGLPVTVASQALQVSMRMQQQVTELAIRGDEVLANLRPVEETPEWATFDEDLDEDGGRRRSAFELAADTERPDVAEPADVAEPPDRSEPYSEDRAASNGFAADPWVLEERALASETEAHEHPPGVVEAENYDELSLPQLRARLRRYSESDLAELLEYERSHANRPEFAGMLARRIETVRAKR